MKPQLIMRCGAAAIGVVAAAASAGATARVINVTTFDTGRFVATTGEVYAGLFRSSVTIDSLTVGEATFRAHLDEFIEVSSVRIYVAPAMDADVGFELLSDEQIASGNHGVTFAVGRDIDRARFSTALDVMQGLDLSRMLYTDGTMRVRVDVLLASPLRDSTPGELDRNPEVLLLGSLSDQQVSVAAVIGGNVDRPILAHDPTQLDPAGFEDGRTGIAILNDVASEPLSISIIGVDLFALSVLDDAPALGYRLEIEAGEPAAFNVVGTGRDRQRELASPMAMLDEPEDFVFDMGTAGGWEPRGGLGSMGLAMGQPLINQGFRRAGGFSGGGGGGGGGGFPTVPPTSPPPDNGNGDNGNGSPDPDPGNGDNGGPVVPAPGTLIILLASALTCRTRRRRDPR